MTASGKQRAQPAQYRSNQQKQQALTRIGQMELEIRRIQTGELAQRLIQRPQRGSGQRQRQQAADNPCSVPR